MRFHSPCALGAGLFLFGMSCRLRSSAAGSGSGENTAYGRVISMYRRTAVPPAGAKRAHVFEEHAPHRQPERRSAGADEIGVKIWGVLRHPPLGALCFVTVGWKKGIKSIDRVNKWV